MKISIERLLLIGVVVYFLAKNFSPAKHFQLSKPLVKFSGFTDGKPTLKITIPIFSKLPFAVPLESFKGQLLYKGYTISEFFVNDLGDLDPGQDSIIFQAAITSQGISDTIQDILQTITLDEFEVKGHLTYNKEGIPVVIPVSTSYNLLSLLG